LESSAISQLAKNESPSMCKMRLWRALTGNRHGIVSAASVHAELFTTRAKAGTGGAVSGDGNWKWICARNG
jgi:hypothetical protein